MIALRAALVGLTLAVLPVAALAESLGDTLAAAYRNSNLLEQNRALLRVADEDVAVAVAALRPVLDFALRANYTVADRKDPVTLVVNTTSELTASLALTAEILLYDFGASRLGIEAAKELVLGTRQSLIGVEHRVLLDAVTSYLNIRLAEETVVLRQGNVRVIERELKAAQDRFELGEITRTDVAIAQARLAGARSNLAAASGELMVERERFNLAVGRYPGRLAPPPRAPQTARTLDEARAIARRVHYSLRQAQHELKAAEINVARADARMKPRVTAGASASVNDSGLKNGAINLGVTQRLYSGGQLSALYRQALARRDAARGSLQRRAQEIDDGVGRAWAQLAVARASIAASEQQVRAAQTAYDGVREEASLGARTTLDVLNAEQELLDARAGLLRATTSQYTATYGLLAAMGLLTAEHLKLGVPTYDPDAYFNAVKSAPATSSRGKALDRVMGVIGQ